MCKVSVIIYVKNTVDYIEQCVRSAVGQTLKDIEILVVDGGSTDGTLDIVGAIMAEDNRIKLFHSAPSVGVQFNLAMQNASGEYIAICEADDYIPTDMYEKQYEIAQSNDIDVLLASHFQFCTVDGKEYRFKIDVPIDDRLCDRLLVFENSEFVQTGAYSCWSGLYKREFLNEYSIRMSETKGASYQDISFTFLANLFAKRVWIMRDAFYCYRVDNPTASMCSPNCISMCIEEYERLRDNLCGRELLDRYIGAYISWKLWSFYGFIHDLGRVMGGTYLEKIFKILKIDYEMLSRNPDSRTIKNADSLVKALGEDIDSFKEALFNGLDEEEKTRAFFDKRFSGDEPVGLLGLGKMGELVMQYSEIVGGKLIFIDNNPDYQESGFKGHEVYSPQSFSKKYVGCKCIVASINAGSEMKAQLLENEIKEDDIITCNNMYLFIRKIFAKASQKAK